MMIYLPNLLNTSKQNLAFKEQSHKLDQTFPLLSSLKKTITYYGKFSFKNYSIENNEIEKSVMNFDESDFNRLEIQHRLFRIIWNNNFSSPLQHQFSIGRLNVLEVGSCPSIWTFDMASEYPSSTFIGIENISAITDSFNKLSSYYSSKIPESRNATVLQMNSTLTIPFPEETFDFVYHNSSIITPLSQSLIDPLNTINQMIRVLKPGGWLEFMIIENKWYNIGPITQYMKNSYLEFLSSFGINNLDCTCFERHLSSRKELSCVLKQTKEIPIGSFGGRISEFFGENLLNPIKFNKHNLYVRMKISEKKFDELFNVMLTEINQYKTFCKSFRLYAKKLHV